MELLTPRLLLREFRLEDLVSTQAYAGDAEVTRYMLWGPNPEAETRAFLEQKIPLAAAQPRTEYELAVVIRDRNLHIGGTGIRVRDEQADLGYILARAHWGHGYATEAGRALLGFGFQELKLHRIFATCNVLNTASAHVLEKLGMRREGHFHQSKKIRGAWRDDYLYAILAEEWKP